MRFGHTSAKVLAGLYPGTERTLLMLTFVVCKATLDYFVTAVTET